MACSVQLLRQGGIIAYPTETFYGLGAKYDIEPALQRLYDIKKRPGKMAMPVIIGCMEQLAMLTGRIPDKAGALISKFWPGPLTLLFEARRGLSDFIIAENKVAVRMPGESFALRLAKASGFPVTATSANISGMPPGKNIPMVVNYFNDSLDLIIDGGESESILPSTIVDATGPELTVLRQGLVEIR
ncbi:MAG TPA: L-threonylcarbamoyladenylate synthase [Dissulfurispiraceae bacterium]|nr:L-threonylcarbamoyladenylate synthase [Dissulfurispiraceae bacterium]